MRLSCAYRARVALRWLCASGSGGHRWLPSGLRVHREYIVSALCERGPLRCEMVGRLLVANVDDGADLDRKLNANSVSRGAVSGQRWGSD